MKGIFRLPVVLAFVLVASWSCKRSSETAGAGPAAGPGVPVGEAAAAKENPNATIEAVEAVDLEVGRVLKPDNHVADKSTHFQTNDSVYVVVVSKGSVSGVKMQVMMSYQTGATVYDSSRVVDLKGPATTVFQASNPSGWPAGKYQLRVMVTGKSYRTWDFDVK